MPDRSTGDRHINRKGPRDHASRGSKHPSAPSHSAESVAASKKISKAAHPEKTHRKRFATPGHIPPSQTVVPFIGKSATGGEPLSVRIASHGNNLLQFDPGVSKSNHSLWTSELDVVQIGQDWIGVEITHAQESKEPLSLFWRRVWTHFLITDESRQRVLRDLIHFAIEIDQNKPNVSKQEFDYWIHMIREESLAILEVISNDSTFLSTSPQQRTTLINILGRLKDGNFQIQTKELLNLGNVMEIQGEDISTLQSMFHSQNYQGLIELTKSYRFNGSDWMDIEDQWFISYLTSTTNKDLVLKHYLVFLAEGYQRGYCIEDNRLLDRMYYIIHELNPSLETIKLIREPLKFLTQVLLIRRATWQEKDSWYSFLGKLYDFTLSIASIQS
jgi:hypothetical protein